MLQKVSESESVTIAFSSFLPFFNLSTKGAETWTRYVLEGNPITRDTSAIRCDLAMEDSGYGTRFTEGVSGCPSCESRK